MNLSAPSTRRWGQLVRERWTVATVTGVSWFAVEPYELGLTAVGLECAVAADEYRFRQHGADPSLVLGEPPKIRFSPKPIDVVCPVHGYAGANDGRVQCQCGRTLIQAGRWGSP